MELADQTRTALGDTKPEHEGMSLDEHPQVTDDASTASQAPRECYPRSPLSSAQPKRTSTKENRDTTTTFSSVQSQTDKTRLSTLRMRNGTTQPRSQVVD